MRNWVLLLLTLVIGLPGLAQQQASASGFTQQPAALPAIPAIAPAAPAATSPTDESLVPPAETASPSVPTPPVVVAAAKPLEVAGPPLVIYDDDCSQDVNCAATLPILYALEERGELRVLAMVADSANPLSAPVMRLFSVYDGRSEMTIGANQGNEPETTFCKWEHCNGGPWAKKLVERFDRGDSREKYPDCVAVYRKVLAKQAPHSVTIVATGFATCLNGLLGSGADDVSQLSGADLVKQTVKLLSVTGGKYPAGKEWNFQSDAPNFERLFAQWTKQNGFPPVYLNSFSNGEHVLAGPPKKSQPKVNPTMYAMQLAYMVQRPMCDILSAMFVARGLEYQGTTYFNVSEPGTVTVDGKSGADSWSSQTDSGHYVLTDAASNKVLSAIFDGYAHDSGFLAGEPGTTQE